MSKFTRTQKERIKELIIQAELQNLTRVDTARYIKENIKSDVSLDYIDKIKRAIRKESYGWIQKTKNTKDHYISQFHQRIKEIELYRGMLFKLYYTAELESTKLGCIAQMLKTTEDLVYLYDMLPSIGAHVSPLIDNNYLLKKRDNNQKGLDDKDPEAVF